MLDTDREDAATGSAAGCLSAYLVEHGVLPAGVIEIAQGAEMGRPSRLIADVTGRSGQVTAVAVTGDVTIWGEGRLTTLPPNHPEA